MAAGLAKRDKSEVWPDGGNESNQETAGEDNGADDAHDESPTSSTEGSSQWGILAIAGICGLCCVSLAALGGGAAVAGGTAVGVTTAGGVIGSLGGALVVGLATALPLFLIGLFLRRRSSTS